MLIYKAINKINGKIYIGLTTRDNLEKRIKEHKRDSLTKDTYFYRAIQKYGFDNFTWEVIENDINNQDYLDKREKYWIAYYNTQDSKNGYNIQSGGHSFKVTQKEKNNRSERVAGEKNYFYNNPYWKNKHFSEEHRQKISVALKGRKKDSFCLDGNPSAKKIINLSTGEIFDCIKIAAKQYNITPDAITNNIKGKTKYCANCKWELYEEDCNYIIEPRIPRVKTSYYVEELKKCFKSATDLSKAIQCDNSLIGKKFKNIPIEQFILIKNFHVKKVLQQ